MLQKQNISVSLGTGIDTKSDPKIIQGKLLNLENAVFVKPGKAQKRFGLTSLGNTILNSTSLTSGNALVVFQSELGIISGNSLYGYSSTNDKWIIKSTLSSVAVSSVGIIRNNYTQSVPDVAYSNGLALYAWEDSSGGIRASVLDQSTGQMVLSNQLIHASGIKPKCCATQDSLFVYFVVTNTLYFRKIDSFDPKAFGTATSATTDIHATAIFDIDQIGTVNIISYRSTTPNIKTAYLTISGVFATVLDGLSDPATSSHDPDGSICILANKTGDINTDAIYIFYHNSTSGTCGIVYNLGLSNTPSQVVLDSSTTLSRNITATMITTSQAQIWYEVTAAASYNHYIKTNTLTLAGSGGTATVWLRSVGLISKAFIGSDGLVYLLVAYDSTLQPTVFTIRSDGSVANRISYQNSGGLTAKVSSLTNVINVNGTFIAPSAIKNVLESESGVVYSINGIQASSLKFGSNDLFNTAQLGNNLHIAGGILYDYDGVNVVEHGFNMYPENATAAVTNTSGAIEAGTRQYEITYEWSDLQGQIHRSAPSIPISTTTTGGASYVDLTIPTLRITERKGIKGEVSIVIYRTVAAGTTFYRVSSISSPLFNSTTVDTVSYHDNTTDASILSNELLYTTGGVLENIAPPSATIVYTYNNRVVIAGLEDANEIWYSKQFVQNEAVAFTDLIKTRIDQGKRGITGICQLDEKLIFFKDNQIFYQLANGPTDTGFNNDIGTPQAIATDVGCISNKSIVVTPLGLIFKSKKGYYLLDRSLQVSYIGAEVEAYNSLTCSGATLLDDVNQVRFTHSDGNCLVYDYFLKQWSVFTNYNCVSSKRWSDSFVILRSTGLVDKENKATNLDNSSHVQLKALTEWVQVAGIQGFQRIYNASLIGELKSAHTLSVRVGYNFQEHFTDTFTIDTSVALGNNYYGQGSYYGADVFEGGMTDPIYQFKINNSIQKCQAIRFEISDYSSAIIDGQGMTLTGLTLNVGLKQGTNRVPVTKNM